MRRDHKSRPAPGAHGRGKAVLFLCRPASPPFATVPRDVRTRGLSHHRCSLTTRLTTLPNGFRIVTEHMPGLQSASAGIWVTAGGRHEAEPQNGIAHFLEHKMFEPAFYATVIQDWGSSLLAAQSLGEKARCLVDLGHHAPNTNIEMIVARLVHAQKLAGFHFNDSKYGDDDLDSGSINPFQLFLVFNELVDAAKSGAANFDPAYMLDQSHNVTDPIESLMTSAATVQRCYAQALLVDRKALTAYQDANDVLMAAQTLKQAFHTDVTPILQKIRMDAGGAVDPVAAYRASGYRKQVAAVRPASGPSSGIV